MVQYCYYGSTTDSGHLDYKFTDSSVQSYTYIDTGYSNPYSSGTASIRRVVDIDEDMNEEVIIEKDGHDIDLTRKELYEVILLLEEENETIKSVSLERLKEILVSVKI